MKQLLSFGILILIVSLFSPNLQNTGSIHFPLSNHTAFHPETSIHSSLTDHSSSSWVVTEAPTNIRTEPTVTAPISLVAPTNSWFPVLQHKNNWDQVRIDTTQTGWVADWVVQNKQISKQSLQTVHITASTPLMEGPGTSFPKHNLVSSTAAYIPIKVAGLWVEIRSTDAVTSGWVPVANVAWNVIDRTVPEAIPASTSVTSFSNSANIHGPLTGKTIVIDPGHGGSDVGAIGTPEHVYERDVNLAAAAVLQNKLQAAGAHVIMTRTSNDQDVSLAARTKISNENHADLFISIHQNMFRQDPSVNGTITYYYYDSSKKAAQAIENGAIAALSPHFSKSQIKSGAMQQEKFQVKSDDLFVLRNNHQPAVLIEGCFLSNPTEVSESMEPSYQEHLASGIYHGVLQYFSQA